MKAAPHITFRAPRAFDAEAVALLKPDIDRLSRADADVVIDLGQTQHIDGSGFGAIAFVHKRLRARGLALSLAHVSGQPARLMAASGMLYSLTTSTSASAHFDVRQIFSAFAGSLPLRTLVRLKQRQRDHGLSRSESRADLASIADEPTKGAA